MKIRSHTGNMVEVRDGMRVNIKGLGEGVIKINDGIVRIETPCKTQTTIGESDIELVSCPFVVGDVYDQYQEGVCGFEDRWAEGRVVVSQEQADRMNSGKLMFPRRHSNPDLRSKGGV